MTLAAETRSRWVAVLCGVVVAIFLVAIGSREPLHAVRVFLLSPVTNRFYFGNMLATASILLIGGLGVSIAFRGGSFNLGGEGQVYMPGLVATIILLRLPLSLGWLGVVAALVAAAATGATMAGISGVLRAGLGVPEIISSYLLSAASIPLVDYLIVSVLRDPQSNLLTTRKISESFQFSRLLEPSNLTTSVVVAVLLFVSVAVWFYRSTTAYRLRLVGLQSEFARYCGFSVGGFQTFAMVVSGALYGMGGGLLVTGVQGAAIVGFGAGYGWNGIAVALIAALRPEVVPIAALVIAFLDTAARAVSVVSQVPPQVVTVIQAVILLAVTIRGRRVGEALV